MIKIQVVETETGEVIHEVPCENERKAERVYGGMMINLDAEKYHLNEVEIEK